LQGKELPGGQPIQDGVTIGSAALREGHQNGVQGSGAADARRWIEIYSRLVEFKEELLERANGNGANGNGANGNGANGHHQDGDVLSYEKVDGGDLEQLRTRLSHWQRVHARLAPVDLDDKLGIVTVRGEAVALTRRENQLLSFLLEHPARFFDTRTLASRAWHDPHLASEQVRTYVVRLRRRLHEAGVGCDIRSERRRGYALIFDEALEQAATA
jgi:DNA-binding winged helix-turn-helix (wHTH) protein